MSTSVRTTAVRAGWWLMAPRRHGTFRLGRTLYYWGCGYQSFVDAWRGVE